MRPRQDAPEPPGLVEPVGPAARPATESPDDPRSGTAVAASVTRPRLLRSRPPQPAPDGATRLLGPLTRLPVAHYVAIMFQLSQEHPPAARYWTSWIKTESPGGRHAARWAWGASLLS